MESILSKATIINFYAIFYLFKYILYTKAKKSNLKKIDLHSIHVPTELILYFFGM